MRCTASRRLPDPFSRLCGLFGHIIHRSPAPPPARERRAPAWVNLDLLMDHMAEEVRRWTARMDEAGLARVASRHVGRRPAWLGGAETPGGDGDPPGDPLCHIAHYGIARFDLEADIRLASAAPLDDPGGQAIRFALVPAASEQPPSPGATAGPRAVPDTTALHIQLDAAAAGVVRIGAWQATVLSGRRTGRWVRSATPAAPEPRHSHDAMRRAATGVSR